MRLNITDDEYRDIVEKISQEAIDEVLQDWKNRISATPLDDEEFDRLLNDLEEEILFKIEDYILMNDLVETQYRWEPAVGYPTYRYGEVEPDRNDIPNWCYDLELWLPNLKEDLRKRLN